MAKVCGTITQLGVSGSITQKGVRGSIVQKSVAGTVTEGSSYALTCDNNSLKCDDTYITVDKTIY